MTLPKDLFEAKPNLKLLAQAIHVYEDRMHSGLRKAQTRSEVNRTTKKLYKQKGTGGARHGSRRAPIFVGGGVALGPRPVSRVLTLSDSLKSKAKAYAFSVKANEHEIIAVDGISKVVKTKEAASFLNKVSGDIKAKRFTFVLGDKSIDAIRALRNLGNARTVIFKDINAYDIWKGGLLILDEGIFAKSKKAEKPAEKPVKKVVAEKGKKDRRGTKDASSENNK